MFLYSKQDVIGRITAHDLFAPSDREYGVWDQMVKDAMARGKCERMVSLLRRDGTIFPALVDLTPLRNADGQILGTLFLGRDVSETLRTQRELRARKDELEFINNLTLKISETLKLEEIASVSLRQMVRQFEGIVGGLYFLDREAMQFTPMAFSQDDLPNTVKNAFRPSLEDGLLMEKGEALVRGVREYHRIKEYGSNEPRVTLMIPLVHKASLIGAVSIVTPLHLRRDEELLRFTNALGTSVGGSLENAILFDDSITKSQEIAKQNQELDEFAYVVSHDLKEPLAGISFISNLLVDEYYESFDETGKTYISSLIDFSKRLGSLIDALLDLSRIGRISSPPERVDLKEVLYNVEQNLSHRISKNNASLVLPKNVPYVYGDKTRIEQVFFNLIGNAIKFNDKPNPSVHVLLEEADNEFWQFGVKDNGIGIEPEYFEKIFKIFERLQPREEYEGNGAGLTIVKRIIEHHDGNIWLESELDKGTTFYFTLPKFQENQ